MFTPTFFITTHVISQINLVRALHIFTIPGSLHEWKIRGSQEAISLAVVYVS